MNDDDFIDTEGGLINNLSCSSKLFILLLLSGVVVLAGSDLAALGLCLIISIPTWVLGIIWYKRYSSILDPDVCIHLYAGSFLGAVVVMIAELVLAIVFAVVCFADQMDDIDLTSLSTGGLEGTLNSPTDTFIRISS